jgi:TfoX/Sxy family transcriptional regulator of competence genes
MTAEESLSVAVRGHLSRAGVMSEVKMFGGTGFMLNRNLVAAVSKRGLLLRVGKDRYRDALAWPGARPMEMRDARWKAMSISTRLWRRMTCSKHGSTKPSHL